MKKNNKTLSLVVSLLVLTTFVACKSELPIQEMANARGQIARAESLQASDYAPDELAEAKKSLFKAHEEAAEENSKEAKKNSEYAASKANDALEKTLPKLATKTREEATKEIDAADAAFATGLAPEQFDRAIQLRKEGDAAIETADKNLGDYIQEKDETKKSNFRQASFDDYETAYTKFLESKKTATQAKDIAISSKSELKQSGRYVEEDLNTVDSYMGGPNPKTRKERENLAQAYTDIDNGNLKSAYERIEASKAQSRVLLSESIQNYARERNMTATEVVEDANARFEEINEEATKSDETARKSYENSRENLGAANESLASAGNLYSQEKYEDSIRQSEEAIRLGEIVVEQTAKITPQSLANRSAMNKEASAKSNPTYKSSTSSDDAQLAAGWSKYKVRKQDPEDCLWRIAKSKSNYGNPRLWPRIYEANKSKIKNKNLIYPNQVLYIPPKTGPIGSPFKKDSEESMEEPTVDEDSTNMEESGTMEKEEVGKPVNGPEDDSSKTGTEEEILEEEPTEE
ncbi:MAG: DUF4398 domain-containing protein [Leptospira sp.]|nr:DUF4398 domain-containing protein [Leptospira sp.]NCS93577.1 DUF4398 domain-containing protein [Leptospira sp.]